MRTLKHPTALLLLALIAGCGGSSSNNPGTVSLSPSSAALAPGDSVQLTATASSGAAIHWLVNGIAGGSAALGTIDAQGRYVAPAQSHSRTVFITAETDSRPSAAAFGAINIIEPGQVAPTQNSQVAAYTINLPAAGKTFIEFGPDTSYGLKTSAQSSPRTGGPVTIQVAGMRAFTQYHMRAVVQLSNGAQFFDRDQIFTTGGLQGTDLPVLTAQTTPGATPQPGIELVNTVQSPGVPVYATDLAGNVIWWYKFTDGSSVDLINPIQPLANGHFLVTISGQSGAVLGAGDPPGTINVMREIDLAGNTIRELTPQDLNARLSAAGFNLNIVTIHHEVLPLPNGHFIVVVNDLRPFSNLTGFTGTVNVLGDDLIDLDPSFTPVWTWSSFDHLDVNRHPMQFPDWTHTNAVVYLPQEGNLLISMRHQHWIIKIDYRDSAGTGAVLWRLGNEGDFTLQGGTDPTDWFYGQHGARLVNTEAPGLFSISLMDNGNNRVFAAGQSCATLGLAQCPYSSGGVYRLDESAKTATLTTHFIPPYFSTFGGYSAPLANGNMEFDFCAAQSAPQLAVIYEVTQGSNPQVVWQMSTPGFAYRAFRMPSLYPGVQW